jgi:hypothetical protein
MTQTIAKQCEVYVHVRDTYRYHGGKQRFKMHYRKQRCSRKATKGWMCTQHAKMAEQGRNFLRVEPQWR